MSDGDAALKIRDLTVTYVSPRGVEGKALRGVNLNVRRGTIHGIVGETGSGKSTIARTILRLGGRNVWVNEGTIEFAGHGDLAAMSKRAYAPLRGTKIGYIGQSPFGALHPILPIERQFHQIFRSHGMRVSRDESRAVAGTALVSVGIPSAEAVLLGRAHQLSGGMAQRVVIAMACVLEPDLIVADEPTTSLDLTTQRQILDLIERKVHESDVTVLLITHDLGVVAQYCDAVTVLYAGRVMEDGPVRTVLSRPAHPYTRALLAASPDSGRRLGVVLEGDASRAAPETGCPFRTRCPIAISDCQRPVASEVVADDWVAACVRAGEEPS